MAGWVGNIEETTLQNETFRTVVFTSAHAQLTVMNLQPGEEIGWEAHPNLDQFLRVEQGRGRVEMGPNQDRIDEKHDLGDNWAVVVPAGNWHNVVNTGTEQLKLYSLYAPPEHPPGTVHATKAEADAAEHAERAEHSEA